MRPALTTSILAALTAISASAQVDPRAFAPRDYTAEFHVDMAAVIDSGLWDLVERSPARMLLAKFHEQFGFDIADLDEARLLQRTDPPAEGDEWWQQRHEQVWFLKGSERVGLVGATEGIQAEYPLVDKVGGIEVRRAAYGSSEVASPASGVLVFGVIHEFGTDTGGGDPGPGPVTQTLTGKRNGGTPVPDLMALTASPRALLVFAGVWPRETPMRPESMQPLPSSWFDREDLPRGVRIQLVRSADGERLAVELLMRFAGGGRGPQTMADGFAATCAELGEDPQTRMFATALEPVQTKIDGGDLTLSLDLGTEREMGARLSPLLVSVVGLAVSGGAAPAPEPVLVDALEEPEAIPATEKKKRD